MRVRLEVWPEEVIAEVDAPEGYYRVFSGALKPGDLFLNRVEALAGHIFWLPVKLDDPLHTTAGWYTCVIRPGSSPAQEPCERCGCEAKVFGQRYCRACARALVREAKENG